MLAEVPTSLRLWFRVHCAVDVAAALPLLLFPARALGLLGWTTVDPVTARLVGAALLAIGAASQAAEGHGVAGYRVMLTLNVVWSLAAVFAFFAGIAGGAPPAAWAFLSIFIALSGVWLSHAIRLRQLARVMADDSGDDGDQSHDEDEGHAGPEDDAGAERRDDPSAERRDDPSAERRDDPSAERRDDPSGERRGDDDRRAG
jgi:hypothetical protein